LFISILYLPEFDLYDDPTQNFAAFGVLVAATYDKPVVRVGANGVTLGRTPAMNPNDHTSHATTILNVKPAAPNRNRQSRQRFNHHLPEPPAPCGGFCGGSGRFPCARGEHRLHSANWSAPLR
jgi:hypothetical protein